MYLDAFLERHGITLRLILDEAHAAIRLVPGDVLFLCGSLIEGLGNEQSDVDLYLLTSRRDITFNSLNDVILLVGPCLVEVRVKQYSAVEALVGRAVEWSRQPRDARAAFDFSEEERKFLHRLRSGRPLYGGDDFERLQGRLNLVDLARHRLDWACHLARNLQIDLAGLRSEGDAYTMLFAAQELLGHTIDGLLAGHGYTNPAWKWRVRQLAALPDDWEQDLPGRHTGLSAPDRYLSLHRPPADAEPRAILEYGLRIVAFSRCVLPWAERQRLGANAHHPPLAAGHGAPGSGERLPHLDLNVAVLYHEGRFELARLNSSEPSVEISPETWLLLSLFDGETSYAEAVSFTERLFGEGRGRETMDGLLAFVRYANFEAGDILDEQALGRLLAADPRV